MSEFESYIPKRNPEDTIRFHMNTISEWVNKTNKNPDYTVVYDKIIDKNAYGAPSWWNYLMKVQDPLKNTIYRWHRSEYTMERFSENYSKPATIIKGSEILYSSNIRDGFWFNTSNLWSFIQYVNSTKDLYQKNLNYLSVWEIQEFEKTVVFTLADMQRVWSSDGNYNKDIIPSAGTTKDINAFNNALEQLKKPIPTDEQMFDQYNLWDNPNKIICRDFAIVTARIAKKLWFEAVAGTIEVGVSHAFTILRSPDTGKYYGISADSVGWDSKIFEWSSLTEIRSTYQNHLIALWRAPHFWWVFLDDDGRVIGKWQSDIERRRSKDFLGWDTPTRLLKQSLGTDITLNQGKVGSIDYMSLITQKWINIPGKIIDSDIFFRGGITRMGIGDSTVHAIDWWLGTKVTTKPLEIQEGMTARAYIAADINLSIWHSDQKWTQVPYISGNTVIGWELKYTSWKWNFTTDLGTSYEFSWPNQMQHPLMKILPSGEYVIFSGEYHGDTANILGKAVFENYFNAQRKELSLWIRSKNDMIGSIYTRETRNNIPWFPQENTQEVGLWIGGKLKKDIDWKVETWKINWPMGSSNSVNTWITIKF